MVNEKYTTEGLPIVSEAISEIIARDFHIRGDEGTLFDEGQKILEIEQPILYKDMIMHGKEFGDYFVNLYLENRGRIPLRQLIEYVYRLGIDYCYRSLRRQAEANKLEKEVNKI